MKGLAILNRGVLLIAGIWLWSSCEQDFMDSNRDNGKEVSTQESLWGGSPRVVTLQGESTFKFNDKKHFKQWANYIGNLSDVDQVKLAGRLGVTTFYSAYLDIVNEIEKSFTNTPTSHGNNYYPIESPYAIFLSTDDSEMPECRARSLSEANIANRKGIYMIGDSVCEVSCYKDAVELKSDNSRIELEAYSYPSYALKTNGAFAENSGRRARVMLQTDNVNFRILLRFSAQRKSGFIVKWWDRYSTTFGSIITIYSLSHQFEVLGTQATSKYSSVKKREKGGTQKIDAPFILEDSDELQTIEISTKELKAEVLPLGRFLLQKEESDISYGESCRMVGKIAIWSRGVPQHQAGYGDIDIKIPIHLE